MMIENPFITYGYESAAYFYDLKCETKELVTMLTNGNHVAQISPWRMEQGIVNRWKSRGQAAIDRFLRFVTSPQTGISLDGQGNASWNLGIGDILYLLTTRQRDFLVAVSREGKAKQITGMSFIKRHHLSSASSVQKSAQALMEKQLLTHRQGVCEIYDKFMPEWLHNS